MLCFSINNKIFFIQGRVIKKAKRRNLNEDQKQNIFNSFGGFSSTNSVTASEAFSFLAAPASNGSSAAPVFGSVSKDEGAKTEENNDSSEPQPPQEEKVNGIAPLDDTVAKSEQNPPDDLFAKLPLLLSSYCWPKTLPL